MSRRTGKTAMATAYALEQLGKMHRSRVADTSGTLKTRARAARMAGLESVTVHLPIADAILVADALAEWARRQEQLAAQNATTGRKESAT